MTDENTKGSQISTESGAISLSAPSSLDVEPQNNLNVAKGTIITYNQILEKNTDANTPFFLTDGR